MPHLYVEYTDNLAGLPGQQLLTQLNAFVCGHPSILDEADVKARLLPVSQFEMSRRDAKLGRGLREGDLIGPRIDREEEITLPHDLAVLEKYPGERAAYLRAQLLL